MTLPPSGSGRPPSVGPPFAQVDDLVQALVAYVSWPSWMISPACTVPSCTASLIWSNGMTTGSNVGLYSRKARNAVVSRPGLPR